MQFASSENLRKQKATLPEYQLGLGLKEEAGKVNGYRILRTNVVSQSQIVLDVYFDGGAESNSEVRRVKMERVDGEWKLAEIITH